MDDELAVKVLLNEFTESTGLARQAEDQRAAMSNILILIAAAIVTYLTSQEYSPDTILASIFVIILGLYGLVMSAKYAQHYHRNYSRASLVRDRLQELCPASEIKRVEVESSEKNRLRYPFLRTRLPILYLWLGLHGAICALGILSIVLTLI